MGRKSDSSERFARSIAKIRLATSLRRAELNRDSTEGRAGILALQHRLPRNVGDIGGIAQPHVETLRADRRQHMRGFADQRDALPGELPGLLDRQRKQVTAGLDADTAENGMRLPLGGIRQFRHRSAPSAARLHSGS